jgi:DNA polymerase-3 subunit gamma/tau
MLSKAAFNALLKIMEEPPEYLMFILATTEINRVPDTIVSRCQVFNFKKLTADEIVERLKYIAEKENIKYTESALYMIADVSD